MSQISQWSKSAALLVLGFTVAKGLTATASVAVGSEPTPLVTTWVHAMENVEGNTYRNLLNYQPRTFPSTLPSPTNSFLLTQGLIGQCRAAARSIFIYAERSTANPIRALQADEQVTLAEASGRNGWIAIGSPISGFVQAKDLKPCTGNPAPTPSPTPPNRCRRVIYEEDEGLAIRESPNTNSARVGGVFFGDRVTLSDPPQFRLDDAGREWVRITSPTSGWLSNGFPQLGDINLKACF
ncbi:SH3 domain-containing protein [Coleofasciculus sp. E2-BRE-01]|jgi:hypothetical protein|uniref:SH3 domain-containing protein n=1 Tax=Coleofasciculus sp. E2-BRE-01 TaxID=3069524 RepID=UPI0032F6398C